MGSRLRRLAHLLQRATSVAVALLLVAVVAAGVTAYLVARVESLPLLRALTGRVGQLLAGQRTEHLALDLRVVPAEGRLAGYATVMVRNLEDDRRRFYFLLNDGLRLLRVRIGHGDSAKSVSAYQLWLLTVVDIDTPVAKDTTIELTFEYDGRLHSASIGESAAVVQPDQILLTAAAFWYPADLQGFVDAEAAITLPRDLVLVHNGIEEHRLEHGDVQEVSWHTARRVAGLSLVAGRFQRTSLSRGDVDYRLYLPSDIQLDGEAICAQIADADHVLTERYGPSGFRQLTLFVSRNLRRGFNDGTGLIGLSVRYFRTGDYGFAELAHEVGHNWWGGTVAEHWLQPGTGGEWIVEGFAEFSSIIAAEAHGSEAPARRENNQLALTATDIKDGSEALTRRLAAELFDPARQQSLAQMSVLDNALAEATTRDTIYRKGAYVAFMLRQILGAEVYFRGLRQFLERFRYQQVTDRDLQDVLQEVSGQDLQPYFDDWVRSNRSADLSIDATPDGALTITNAGTARLTGDIDLWMFHKGDPTPQRSVVHVGDRVPLDETIDYVLLDPLLRWADMQRENNRHPRRSDPVFAATEAGGKVAMTRGEPLPWARATVAAMDADLHTQHTWDFNRGLAGPPRWSPDGARLIVNYADGEGLVPAIVSLAADGTRTTIGRGAASMAGSDGAVYAARGDQIVRIGPDGNETTVMRRPSMQLDAPLPAPRDARLAYTAARGNHLELHLVDADGSNDRLLLSWDRDRMLYRWAPDGTRLYVALGVDWDWQVWELPVTGSGAGRVLASGAAGICDLDVSPDGRKLAFTAVPSLSYPPPPHQLYVLDLDTRVARALPVTDVDLERIAWAGNDRLLAIARVPTAGSWVLPAHRQLMRISLADGSAETLLER